MGHYPRGCTFPHDDWDAIAPFWFPIAFGHSIIDRPIAATLLDQRLVIWRTSQGVSVANDLCLHRGIPMSMGHVENDQLICKYHGFHYDASGTCTLIPASPQATIAQRLCLKTYPVREAYGLVWTTLTGDGSDANLPQLPEWNAPDYQPILPDSMEINAAVGRQMEGFLDVAHFAWVHHEAFASRDNPVVPPYTVTPTPHGLRADYVSSVSNFPKALQHRAPDDFQWRRVFDVFFPFAAILRVHFPQGGQLCILNAPSPISARKTRLFSPLCRNFDQDQPLEPVYEFNRQIFAEDKELIEAQYPEDLPLDLRIEHHIPADKTSIAYRQGLADLGLSKSYTT